MSFKLKSLSAKFDGIEYTTPKRHTTKLILLFYVNETRNERGTQMWRRQTNYFWER